MKLKSLHFADVVEIQKAVTDELKEVQKEEIWQLFRKCTTAQKLYICEWGLFWKRKVMYLPHASSIFKKIGPKHVGLHCV